MNRYEFVYCNDLGEEFPAFERLEFDGEYVKFEDAQSELAALREELASRKAWPEWAEIQVLKNGVAERDMDIEQLQQRLAAAEQRNAELFAEVARRDALLEELGCPFDQVSDLYQKPTESGSSE